MKARRFATILALGMGALFACAAPQTGGPNPEHGFTSMLRGIGHLILSPVQIAAGLLEGVASLPYYAATNLNAINDGLIKAQAKITVDDTYEAAYGKRISQAGPEGDTGEVFRRMKHASEYFQKVLAQHGTPDAQHYILTSIDTANPQGFTLFAVVYRPTDAVTVIDKYDGKTIRKFTREDRLFYEPFAVDVNGKPLDTIVDYAGVPTESYKTQKQQAILLTLSANAVADGKKRSDYWDAEKLWISGAFEGVVDQQNKKVQQSLGLSKV